MRNPSAAGRSIPLGEASAPSGIVLVIDTGLLHFWSHDRVPIMPDWAAGPETVASANSSIDFRVDGSDAREAGRAFNRQAHPFYLFDIPGHGIRTIRASFNQCVKSRGLDARLVRLPRRVTHRERVDLIREAQPGGGEIIYQGIPACVADGVPTRRRLPVVGEKMPSGPDEERWRHVSLVCLARGRVAYSEKVGYVGVDEARLMFADADALGKWVHNDSLDGLAELVFWGRDAGKAARRLRAPRIDGTTWGWANQPEAEAMSCAARLGELCERNGWAVVQDYRPHSHHHRVMKQVRSTQTESGTVEAGGAAFCGFMTSWGDGLFPVYRDLDAAGRLVRVRIDLGNEEIIQRQRRIEEWHWGLFARLAMVSRRVLRGGHPVCYLHREEPRSGDDSGWIVYAGNERDRFVNNPQNWELVPLRDLIERDGSLEEIFRFPAGSVLARQGPDAPFRSVERQ